MSRELKFRVWSKPRCLFIIEDMTPKEIQDDACESMELPILTSEECVWEQFTGVLDMNGQEIYEGDLIIHHISNVDNKLPVLVKWLSEDDGFDYNGWELEGLFAEVGQREIVGNIHEGVDKK